MTRQVQWRRGTTDEIAAFTGAEAEVIYDTDKKTLVAQDGETMGGFPLARADGVGSQLVRSPTFVQIIGLWQTEYDALVDIDPNTLYVILPAILAADVSGQLILDSTLEASFNLI